jgi:hypothetical protein
MVFTDALAAPCARSRGSVPGPRCCVPGHVPGHVPDADLLRAGARDLAPHRQKVTHFPVHALGVLVPEMSLVTVTPVPDGMKFTLPGPSVTLV